MVVAPRQLLTLRLRWHDATSRFGLLSMLTFVIFALVGPLVSPNDPNLVDIDHRLVGPSWHFPLGTDPLGRCILTRLAYGLRSTLGAAVVATCITVGIGLAVGGFAAYRRGIPGTLAMRGVDVLLGLPSLIIALAIVGVLGPSMWHLLVGISCVWWARCARIVFGLVSAIRERLFVEASRSLGARPLRILVRHIFPNILPTISVLASLELGELTLAISALSFLGLGPQPPTPELGAMLSDSRAYFLTTPQLMILPGVVISLIAISANLVGEAVRDSLDRAPLPSRGQTK